jgi:coproporphyrinogen III oxidase
MSPERSEIEAFYRRFQADFCTGIEAVDGRARFGSDVWERPGGGGGDTRILAEGPRIEKAAVNFSAVWGDTPPALSEGMAAAGDRFYATGVSIIVHPRNPHAPTFHANLRYFEGEDSSSWFGGGADLTPCYLYEEDARHFHAVLREVAGRHDVADHCGWKRACDEYFRLPHRGESRGVGGIFFDHLTEMPAETWAFQQDLAAHLLAAYAPILARRVDLPYGESETRWQELRRGRYVEFNLVWDRGTRFGLDTNGRTESILASLPPRARWDYGAEPDPGSPEADLLELVRNEPRDWS